jgi:hypothetical protein
MYRLLSRTNLILDRGSTPSPSILEDYYTQSLLSVGNIAILIRDAILNEKIIDTSNGANPVPLERCVYPPLLRQFPFAKLSPRDIPPPFHTDEEGTKWSTFLTTKRQEMSSPASLADGEWVGYYSFHAYHAGATHQLIHTRPQFDAAMTNIHFEVQENGGIRATGQDSVGDFRFIGAMDGDGLLRGRKYYAAHWFQWDLSMTPFGLYGLWTIDVGLNRQLGGAVWLWKREWTLQAV